MPPAPPTITLYGFKHSHPVLAARLMLAAKGVPYRVRDCLPGVHPVFVRLAGFDGLTVPAVRIDERRVQGTLRISRALDEVLPQPPLFPADPAARAAVEAAERWGHDELQPIAGRVFRWAGMRHAPVRTWMVDQVVGLPFARQLGHGATPVMTYYAGVIDATDDAVRRDLTERLPAALDRGDAELAAGTIGGSALNAADCQILATLRLLLAFEDLFPLIAARPVGRLALERLPDFPGGTVGAFDPIPAVLPTDWLPAAA